METVDMVNFTVGCGRRPVRFRNGERLLGMTKGWQYSDEAEISGQQSKSDCSLSNVASALPHLFCVFLPATGLLEGRVVAVNWLGLRGKRPEVN